ncbi:MAG: hypothetical protein KA226_09350 [Gemmatimonadales bacterium]|nr:hypothetical protein [Gemmatimonadales bacterium]
MRLEDLVKVLRRELRRGRMRVVDACAEAILRRASLPWRRGAAFCWLAHAGQQRRSLALNRRLGIVDPELDALLRAGHRRAVSSDSWLGQVERLP